MRPRQSGKGAGTANSASVGSVLRRYALYSRMTPLQAKIARPARTLPTRRNPLTRVTES